MKRLILSLAVLGLVARADTSAKVEKEADNAFALQYWDKAQKLYAQAGELRLKESFLYESKRKDDFEIAFDDDDDLALPGTADAAVAREADQQAYNYIRAAYDFEKGAKPRKCDACLKKAECVKGVTKKVETELKELHAFVAKSRDATEYVPPPPKPHIYFGKLKEMLAEIAELKEKKSSADALAAAWSRAGYEAFLHHRDDIMREAVREIAKLKRKPSENANRWVTSLACYDNMKTFPRPESETVAPKTLADLGVKERHTLVVGELDWNAEDATECVEEALGSGATTVIFENRGSPWYVRQIRPRSNQRIVFRKGVRVHMDKVSCQNNDKRPLVSFDGVRNVIFEGEGEPGDVVISKFPDQKTRLKWQPGEGGSGFRISSSKRIVIRNLTSSWNSCDGVGIGGSFDEGPSADIWVENCVFANNYRQGMSVIDCAGLYCRNVSFLDTQGGDPMCGIDFEQDYESSATSDCYFYDCTFGGNVGGAMNWSAGGYFPVTAHVKRCRFLKSPTQHQLSVQARDWASKADNMRAPGKIVFEDCDMEINTWTQPLQIRNSNSYDIDIRDFRIRDLGPRRKDAPEHPVWAVVDFSLSQDDRSWGREPDYDFEKNEGHVSVRGLVVDGFGDNIRPVGFSDGNGAYSVTNVAAEAVINGKKWELKDWFYIAPERGWGLLEPFNPDDYLPPVVKTADTPDELPVAFNLDWNGAWWDPPPEYRAFYFEGGVWKMKRVNRNVRELGLEKLPVAFGCRSRQSRYKLKNLNKGEPFALYFEVPAAGCGLCHLKVSGDADLKNAKGETVDSAKKWKKKYLDFTPTAAEPEVWSLSIRSDSSTIWFYPPLSGIVAEKPEYLPRRIRFKPQ